MKYIQLNDTLKTRLNLELIMAFQPKTWNCYIINKPTDFFGITVVANGGSYTFNYSENQKSRDQDLKLLDSLCFDSNPTCVDTIK